MEQCADNKTNELIALAKNGDGSAFEALLDAYTPLIEARISEIVHDADDLSDDRDDLRQEASIAFFSAIQSYDTAQSDVPFGLFAKVCIRNRLISYLRKLRRRPPLSDEQADASATDEASTDPARALVEQEDFRALYTRIDSLLSPYESRVWWMYVSGNTARQIARLLGRNERSVQNAVFRIRQKLRRALPSP